MSQQTAEIITVQVDVTESRIRAGIARSCSLCPVAMAVGEHLKDEYFCAVTLSEINVYERGHQTPPLLKFTCGTPMAAKDLIFMFDWGRPVSPISFPLTLPAELVRAEVRQ